jgi:CxxC motif-containing protein (DUF1111 family)
MNGVNEDLSCPMPLSLADKLCAPVSAAMRETRLVKEHLATRAQSMQMASAKLGAVRLIVSVLVLLACIVSAYSARPRAFEEPAHNLGARPMNSVHRGLTLFEKSFTVREGLGPQFNAISCASCHDAPVVGGSGQNADKLVNWMYDDDSDALGAPEQRFALTPIGATIRIPSTTKARRKPPSLFGLGQLEAIPVEDLRSHSDAFDANHDGISGRLPWRDDCFGRFGWQSSVCDIRTFVEGALSRELGIVTGPRSRREISKTDVLDLVAYVRGLAPPRSAGSHDGVELFERALCSKCHTPVTGVARLAVEQFEVRAYTDLLVHEMGSGRRTGEWDSRTEFRTPALWGIASTGPPYLHDGSAATLEKAIMGHAGEATDSRRLFSTLNRTEKLQLLRFVSTR